MDDAQRAALISSVAREMAGLLRWARAERVFCGDDDDEHAGWLDRFIAEVEPMAELAYDAETARVLRGLVVRHGPGPWPLKDLAAIAERDVDSVQRVMGDVIASGVAMPLTDEAK